MVTDFLSVIGHCDFLLTTVTVFRLPCCLVGNKGGQIDAWMSAQ